MIRIVKSNVLWFDGRRTRLMGVGSVFRADPALEARWVDEGVAEYADGEPAVEHAAPAPAVPSAPVETQGEPDEDDADEAPDLHGMTRAELADVAEGYGIKPGKLGKAKLIEAIEEAEQAPDLTAAEVE